MQNWLHTMNRLIKLRQHIHKYPELSSKEFNTAKHIERFINEFKPTYMVKLGKTGLAFVFDSETPGSTTMIRADIDALPIQEKNNIDYTSANKNVGHLCGHDGHMTIVAGLAMELSDNPPKKGRVVLLFQPAEETGEGAFGIMEDEKFAEIVPDYIFGLHNIPGQEMHKIICKNGSFAAASKGLTVELSGKTSHAAEPHKGISPTNAVADIIKALNDIAPQNKQLFTDNVLLTIVQINLGEHAFGTSPGHAIIRVTLRAYKDNDLDILTKLVEKNISKVAANENLDYIFSYSEQFPATVNNAQCVALIANAAKINNYNTVELTEPYKWSEDFGYYTEKYKGGFFGLGSGVNQPALHNPNYDFPDELIETGIYMFKEIISQINY